MVGSGDSSMVRSRLNNFEHVQGGQGWGGGRLAIPIWQGCRNWGQDGGGSHVTKSIIGCGYVGIAWTETTENITLR